MATHYGPIIPAETQRGGEEYFSKRAPAADSCSMECQSESCVQYLFYETRSNLISHSSAPSHLQNELQANPSEKYLTPSSTLRGPGIDLSCS